MNDRVEPVLRLEAVSCNHRSGRTGGFALSVDRFTLWRREAIAFVGPSGCGKSTLLDLLALALPPDAIGRFEILPRKSAAIDVARLWLRRDEDGLTTARAAHIAYVRQTGGLLPYLSVRRNIELGQALQGRRDAAFSREIAGRLEIDHLLDRKPAQLSVGQRQRVAIACAIVHRPEVILADEPTASVHPALADAIMALLIEQARENDAALLLATHDPSRAAAHGFELVPIESVPVEDPSGAVAGRSRIRRAVAPASQPACDAPVSRH